jgi:hypothetical protein
MNVPPPGLAAFAESLAQLDAEIAAAEAVGNDVPAEARLMAARLRDLVAALGELTSSLEPTTQSDTPPSGGAPPPGATPPSGAGQADMGDPL